MAESYAIGDLAKEFGVTTRTIRFYEDSGMITPRRDGQRRCYSGRDRVRLMLILRGKRLGFSLAEVREIIDLYDEAPGETGQLRLLLGKIEARRRELLAKQSDLQQALAELDDVAANAAERLAQLEQSKGGRRAMGGRKP